MQFNIYMQVILKLHGSMTGSVGSERRHVKYVSGGGGGAPNCVHSRLSIIGHVNGSVFFHGTRSYRKAHLLGDGIRWLGRCNLNTAHMKCFRASTCVRACMHVCLYVWLLVCMCTCMFYNMVARYPVIGTGRCMEALYNSPLGRPVQSNAISTCLESFQPRCNYCAKTIRSHIHHCL